MVNEAGILVTRTGLGREGQYVMSYSDPDAGFEGEFWTYRREDLEEPSDREAKDFWTVSLGPQFWYRSSEYVDAAEKHIAQSLLTWPLFGQWNPFQASSVRILALKQMKIVHRVITLADVGGDEYG